MKWPQIIVVLAGVVAVALAVRSRRAADSASTFASTALATAKPDIGRPLPPSFDQPGVVSRQIGLMRVYLAVAPEITAEAPLKTGMPAATEPILLVLENDTYQPLAGAAIGWLGAQVGSVTVTHLADGGQATDEFQAEIPLPARADWLSAERRSFTVDWPLRAVAPGRYRITVQLALPDQPALEIATRVL